MDISGCSKGHPRVLAEGSTSPYKIHTQHTLYIPFSISPSPTFFLLLSSFPSSSPQSVLGPTSAELSFTSQEECKTPCPLTSLTLALVSQPQFTLHASESHYRNSSSSKTALWDLFNLKAQRCLPLSLQPCSGIT